MADNNLEIKLTLNDQASAQASSALKKIGSDSQDLGKKSKDATSSIEDGFKSAGKEIKSFRQSLFVITGSIAALSGVVNAWADSNKATRDNLQSLQESVTKISASIGSLLGPTIDGLAKGFKALAEPITNVVNGLQEIYKKFYGLVSFASQFSVAFATSLKAGSKWSDAWKDSLGIAKQAQTEMVAAWENTTKITISGTSAARAQLKNMADELDRLTVLFKVGFISAESFYDGITNKQYEMIQLNTVAAQQLNELATVTREAGNVALQDARNNTQEQIALLNFQMETHKTATQGMAAFQVSIGKSIQQNLSNALTGIITGATTAKEAFAELGKALLKTVVDFMVQKVVASVLEKTLLAGTVAASITAAGSIAAAWAAAAAMVSLATFGGNAGPAAAALTSTAALATALAIPKLAEGTDTVPAMLSPGEMVFPRSMADAIRSGDISVSGPGGSGGVGDIFITIQSVMVSGKDSIKELAEELGFEIDRKLRNARARV